jgi:putative heme-binding domain-containing protein
MHSNLRGYQLVFLGSVTAMLGGLSLASLVADWTRAEGPPARPARKAWTTSRIVGSPDPPAPYRAVNAFPNVRLTHPLLIAHTPGIDRLFVGEQEGKLYSIANRPDATAELFLDLTKDLRTLRLNPKADKLEFVYGLAFHPKFEENRFCYVCYTLQGKQGVKNLEDGTRVSRFRVTRTDPPRADPDSEEIIITWLQGGHNGGDLHFGHDGYLYISTGDAADPNPPDYFKTGQDISDLLSSVLRIDVDHKDEGKNYAVSKDNPFVDLKGARPEVWAYGFRNPWRMSIDRQTGDLWLGDVGWELWEMVHHVVRGGNYGWSVVEARQPINTHLPPGPTPIRPPVIELPHSAAASVTGGYVYRGKRFPEFVGAYIFGDWMSKRIWAARVADDRLVSLTDLIDPTVRVVAFGEDNAGELYVADYDAGTIHTLAKNDSTARPADFPRTLSATGLFASAPDHRPADGVLPFAVSAPQWVDGATTERLFALPGQSTLTRYPQDVPITDTWFSRQFVFPDNTVLARSFALEMERGNPASRRHVETQIMHFNGKDWRGYTYAWNDAGTDAELVPADGAERVFTVADKTVPGGKREQVWSYPARSQCFMCHNPWAGTLLAFNLAQLNRDVDNGSGRKNQLALFEELGALRRVDKDGKPVPPLDAKEIAALPHLADPSDARADLNDRARSYLHGNCGHCHRFGGGGAVDFELHSFTPLERTKTLDVPPHQGTFDLPDARLIAAGDPCRSVVYYRMAKFGRGHMPRLEAELPDEAGLALIRDWIKQLPAKKESPAAANRDDNSALTAADIERRLAGTATALELARTVGCNRLPPAVRDQVLAHAAKLPAGCVRDLFEGYFPMEGRERKLGNNPRPAAILALKGDIERGRALYWSTGMQCQNCHRLGDKGVNLGPELTVIGKTRAKDDILENILDPSRRIEPPYVPYLATTKSGRSISGLLVKKDASEVVLRDAQNQEVRLRAEEIEQMVPSRQSLMPDGLLRDLTAQQAADLLEFLATRR